MSESSSASQTSSTSSGTTWSTIIEDFINAVKNVLAEVANFIAQHAALIAEVMLGLGIAYAIARYAMRIPLIRNVLGRIL